MVARRKEVWASCLQAILIAFLVGAWWICALWVAEKRGTAHFEDQRRVDSLAYFLFPLAIVFLGCRFCNRWKCDKEGALGYVAYAMGFLCTLLAAVICLFGLESFALWVIQGEVNIRE